MKRSFLGSTPPTNGSPSVSTTSQPNVTSGTSGVVGTQSAPPPSAVWTPPSQNWTPGSVRLIQRRGEDRSSAETIGGSYRLPQPSERSGWTLASSFEINPDRVDGTSCPAHRERASLPVVGESETSGQRFCNADIQGMRFPVH